jgi:hypothetical protein
VGEESDVADTSAGYDDAAQEQVLRAMPGGGELIAMFGYVPWFHDDGRRQRHSRSPTSANLQR